MTLNWIRLPAFLLLTSAATAAPGVPGDICNEAFPLAVPSSTLGTTVGATIDDAAPFCGTSITAPGVWFSVTGTGNVLTASTCDAANYDTQINVYCGDCSVDLNDLICVAGQDDKPSCSNFTTELSWCSQVGVEYLILVHGFNGQSGNFTLGLSDGGIPCVGSVSCEPDIITSYCFGEAPAPCNCGNNGAPGNGCANGVYPWGANLAAATPDPTLGMVSTTLVASGMTPLSLCLLVQGTEAPNGGLGVPFGDGLLCVGGSLMRLGVRPTFLGATRFQVMSPQDLVSLDDDLYYQVLYITPGVFDICGNVGRALNSTNGLRIHWSL